MHVPTFLALIVGLQLGCGPTAKQTTTTSPAAEPTPASTSNKEAGGAVKANTPEPQPDPEPTATTTTTTEAAGRMVAQTALDRQRTSGQTQIQPPASAAVAIRKSGRTLIGTFKVCVKADGGLKAIKRLKSTGFPDYDAALVAGMATWTFNPMLVNGKPVPFCAPVTFVYKPLKKPSPSKTSP